MRAYLDLDPVFTQLWNESDGVDMRFDAHTDFVTVSDSVGSPGGPIPGCGRTWMPTLPPVVLEEWPVAAETGSRAATTVGHWRSYGSIHHGGVHYGQKAHSLRSVIELPRRAPGRLALALAIHPDERADLEALEANGWELADPAEVAGDPDAYRRFVQGSWAELAVTKSGYVAADSGWFSDRSACYLASGRPVIAQDTGFGRRLPAGEGLLAFSDADDVVAAIEALDADYAAPSHRGAGSRRGAPRLRSRPRLAPGAAAPVTAPPSDAEVLALLGDAADGALGLSRRPYAYATSAPLEEIRVRTPAGEGPPMILKDLSRDRLIGDAAPSKPASIYEPRREIEAYRRILAPAGIGPRLYGARAGGDPPRGWLLIEKVDGVELWQIGELETWRSAARWLGGFHASFSARAAEIRDANPYLLELDEPHLRALAERARDALGASADDRAPALRGARSSATTRSSSGSRPCRRPSSTASSTPRTCWSRRRRRAR